MSLQKVLTELKHVCMWLRDAGEHEMADRALCAFAALTGSEMPRPDLSYSYVMRFLRKNHPNKVKEFQLVFKKVFEEALDENEESPENPALVAALKKIDVRIDNVE